MPVKIERKWYPIHDISQFLIKLTIGPVRSPGHCDSTGQYCCGTTSFKFEQLPGYVYICSINYPESHVNLHLLNYTITYDVHINRSDNCRHIPEII